MFEIQQFIEDCCNAVKEDNAHAAVKEIVARAVAEPSHVLRVLGEPKWAALETIYRSENLTILNPVWGPHMFLYPHEHRMWAVIGLYCGQEANAFYRRSEGGLIEHGTKELKTKDTIPLGDAVIHAVKNPIEQLTAAIHVYGGDYFATPRSEWDPETFEERPWNIERARRVFEESNMRLRTAASRQ